MWQAAAPALELPEDGVPANQPGDAAAASLPG